MQGTNQDIRYIDESSVRLWNVGDATRPRCEIAGDRCIIQTRLTRCFPLSHPDSFVAIRDADGKEVGIIKEPSKLDEQSQKVLAEQLDRLYFTPVIQRIVSLKQEASMWRWEVDTQRGVASFYLRGVRDSVHEVAPGRWQIYSVDGQRYEIQNYEKLDAKTHTFFESLF